MLKHHKESIEKMKEHYRAQPGVSALFLIGSVATGTERPDSDIDGVAIISDEDYAKRKANSTDCESVWGKCTYPEGYFDVHFLTRKHLTELAETGSEPMRNMFVKSRVLFSDEVDLPELAAKIPVFPVHKKAEKQRRFYCTFKQYYSYFWNVCKPEGFARAYTATGMVYNLYRLILLENEILFPSSRKLERTVAGAADKPEDIIGKCGRFLRNLSDEDALELVESYEKWTSYDYPKEHQFVANNFYDPNEY